MSFFKRISAVTINVLCGHTSVHDKMATKWGLVFGGLSWWIPLLHSYRTIWSFLILRALRWTNELHLCLSHGPALIYQNIQCVLHRVVKTCRIHQDRVQILVVIGPSPQCAAITLQQMSHCEHYTMRPLVRGRIAAVSRFLLLLFVNDGDIAKLCEALKLLVPRVSLKCLYR